MSSVVSYLDIVVALAITFTAYCLTSKAVINPALFSHLNTSQTILCSITFVVLKPHW